MCFCTKAQNVTVDLLCLFSLSKDQNLLFMRLWKDKPGNFPGRVVFKGQPFVGILGGRLLARVKAAARRRSYTKKEVLGGVLTASLTITAHLGHRIPTAPRSNVRSLMRHGTLIHHSRMPRHHQHHRHNLSLNNALRARCPRFAARA